MCAQRGTDPTVWVLLSFHGILWSVDQSGQVKGRPAEPASLSWGQEEDFRTVHLHRAVVSFLVQVSVSWMFCNLPRSVSGLTWRKQKSITWSLPTSPISSWTFFALWLYKCQTLMPSSHSEKVLPSSSTRSFLATPFLSFPLTYLPCQTNSYSFYCQQGLLELFTPR